MGRPRKINLQGNETIDDAVNILLKEKANNRIAYIIFNGVKLDSRIVTLDGAYKAICGCSKEEFEKELEKHSKEINKRVIKESKSMAYSAIEEVRKIKNNKRGVAYKPLTYKVNTTAIKDYLEYMDKYKKYCLDDKKEAWSYSIKHELNEAGEFNRSDKMVRYALWLYEQTGNIMRMIAENESWDKIIDYASNVVSSSYAIFLSDNDQVPRIKNKLARLVVEYSPLGWDFVEKYYETLPQSLKELKEKQKLEKKPNN